ncbi:hypothetical protein [Streptomyces sp. NPDC002547]
MALSSTHDVALAAERRSAARLLLAHSLVTSNGPHRDTFLLIRRHADWLAQRFQQVGRRLSLSSDQSLTPLPQPICVASDDEASSAVHGCSPCRPSP